MLARVDGQGSSWVDPHNGGTYRGVLESSNSEVNLEVDLELERESANTQYTDRMVFTFTDSADGHCIFTGCSESQGQSVGDQSTNYCNLWNLFCGTAEDCCPLHHSPEATHLIVSSSQGAGRTVSMCLGGEGGSGGGDPGQRQTACLVPLGGDADEGTSAGAGDANNGNTDASEADGAANETQAGATHSHGPDGDHTHVGEVSRAGETIGAARWLPLLLLPAAA